MLTLFKPIPIYIKFFANKLEVTRLDTGQSIFQTATEPFSSSRQVITNFQAAELALRSAIRELIPPRMFLQPSLKALVQQMEKLDGGLSQIEMRALRDLAEHAGASHVVIVETGNPLSSQEALKKLSKNKN